MTIKEIETLSGMTRANIRFYEAEGLLSPQRSENGYRDYSQLDLDVLTRIKLLRTLHISLEEIKALHTGEHQLLDALNRHLEQLQEEGADIANAQAVCSAMRNDQVRYDTLDAPRYLAAMERTNQRPPRELQTDTIPKVRSPWRRFFARGLDWSVYALLLNMVQMLIFHMNLDNRGTLGDTLHYIACVLLMLLVEPLLLSRFGTTIGKWILGLRVMDYEEHKLSYSAALERMGTVMSRGEGLYIPFYSLWRNWKSYQVCVDGGTLDWEYDSNITLRDEKHWRVAAFFAAYVLIFGVTALSMGMATMPRQRGEISVAEFSQNFNQLSAYHELNFARSLNERGNWEENSSYAVIYLGGEHSTPQFVFEEENDVMTGMRFTTTIKNNDSWVSNQHSYMALSVISFVKAQKGCGPFDKEVNALLNEIENLPFEDVQRTLHGISVSLDYEYFGYVPSGSIGLLFPDETGINDYTFSFVMEKVDETN